MKEMMFEFVNQYAAGGILVVTCLVSLVIWRMYCQIKRLNRNLGKITEKVQEYFRVIMDEEQENTRQIKGQDAPLEQTFISKEEREMLLNGKQKQDLEQEEAFHAILQEYFS